MRKSPIRKSGKRKIIRKSRKSPIRKSKLEKCIIAVKSKQPKKCFSGTKWIGGKKCYNPWAVCRKSLSK